MPEGLIEIRKSQRPSTFTRSATAQLSFQKFLSFSIKNLQVVATIRCGDRKTRIQGNDEGGNGFIRRAQGRTPTAQEQEADRHVDGHVMAIVQVRVHPPAQGSEFAKQVEIAGSRQH